MNKGIKNYAREDSNLNSQSANKKELNKNIKNKPVQNSVHCKQICPELQQIIKAWPKLSEQQKQMILMILDFSKQ